MSNCILPMYIDDLHRMDQFLLALSLITLLVALPMLQLWVCHIISHDLGYTYDLL